MSYWKIIYFIFVIIVFVNSINAQEQPTIDEMYNMSIEELMSIKVVTAGKKEEKISDIPASVVIVTREEIEKYGYLNCREILENVPGVYITEERIDGSVSVNVRGFWSDNTSHVIVMINGISQLHNILKVYPVGILGIPVESIERVEIIKGPMSVIYGSGAFFGAINIITSGLGEEDTSSFLSVSAGNNGTKKTVAKVTTKKDDLDLTVIGSLFETNGENLSFRDMMSEPGDYSNKKMGSKIFSRTDKYFNISAAYKNFYSHLTFLETDVGGVYITPPIINDRKYSINTSTRFLFGYKKRFNKWLKIDSNIKFFNMFTQGEIKLFSRDEWGVTQNHDKDYEIGLDLFIYPDSKFDITAGGDYKSNYVANQQNDVVMLETVNSYHFIDNGNKVENYAIYSQVNYHPIQRLKLTGGLRAEQEMGYGLVNYFNRGLDTYWELNGKVKDGNLNLIPRFAAVYHVNNNNILKFMYGKAINQPSMFSNNDVLFFNKINGLNMPFLDSEEIETIEVNYFSALFSKITANISIFKNTLNNLIIRKSAIVDSSWVTYSANGGKIVTNGIELSLLVKPTDDLTLDAALCWQNSEDKKRTSVDVSFSPAFLAYAKFSYKFQDIGFNEKNDVVFSITGNYVDEMYSHYDDSPAEHSPVTNPGDPAYIPVGRLGKKTDDYFLIGTNLLINNIQNQNIFVNLRMSNIFNVVTHYPTYDNNVWADKGIQGYGRRFLLSFGCKF